MTTIPFRSEAFARGARMLRTALGPTIAGYLEDPGVVEVMLNSDGRLWIDRLTGGLEDTGRRVSPADAERIVRLVAHHVGTEVHANSPRVSAELPETGERFEGLVPPVVAAPCFAIRRPAVAVFSLDDYVASGIMPASAAELLRVAVRERKNILVAGGTSTGKTTLVNALLAEVAQTSDRVVLIEDTRELQCAAPNLVALRTKDGAASLADLVRSSLRLRPDRIPIGEVRGSEALDLLKAWGTGHPGGIGTLHAGSAIGALRRLEQLIQEAVVTVPRALIAETINLADFLPWAALVREGVVLNKDGSFQRTARFRGPDLDSSTQAELVAITARLNNALRRLGSGWAIFIEAQREQARGYPNSQFPDPVSELVDAERRAQFEEEGAHFESRYFLALLWLPPADDAARAEAWLYENRATGTTADWRLALEGFVDRTDRVLALLDGFMPEIAWLDDAETLTYLHSCVSTRRQRVRVPETPMYLDAILVDEDLTGGLEPLLGRAHLKTLTVMGFPSQTFPGLLDDLNRLAFPYRWSTRAICLDKTDATRLLGKIRRQWFAKRKSIMAILKEVMTNEASVLLDSDAANKALDADAALQELGSDLVGEAYVTATVTVWDEDARIADERLRLVEKTIQGRDFTCMREGVNAVEAWLGSLPGHVYANVRQPPVSTLNLAHMMPFSAVWAGPERDEHFGAPPLFFAKTEGATPFRFALHVGDVGHTLIVGPTGAGKSVLLALMALQFRRYTGSQVFAFDFGGSIRAAALAMGGDWHDLGGALAGDEAEPVALQPLTRIVEPGERAWAAEWIAALLGREAVTVTPELKEHLWSALTSLASAPVPERTLTGLSVLLQSNALKQALQPYTVAGPWGRLLDAEAERLGEADMQAFETEGLIGAGAAPAVLAYLFHRIGDRLDGRPTLLIIDEGWLALDDPGFAGQLREWLKTLRKKNASVVFATQSLADIDGSAIAPAIVESCPTRLFLPNERALEPQIAAIYRRFGLNDRQIGILSRATPKRDYYCQSRRGNRLFDLGLSEVALAFTAASSKTDQAAIAEILAKHGKAGFAAAWLRRKGLDWASEMLRPASQEITP